METANGSVRGQIHWQFARWFLLSHVSNFDSEYALVPLDRPHFSDMSNKSRSRGRYFLIAAGAFLVATALLYQIGEDQALS